MKALASSVDNSSMIPLKEPQQIILLFEKIESLLELDYGSETPRVILFTLDLSSNMTTENFNYF